jgi:hypothetical protein
VYFPRGQKSPAFPRVRLAGASLWPAISGISVVWARVSGAGLCSLFSNFRFWGGETAHYGCARFYWLARTVVGYHNPNWSSARIIKDINWITKHYGTGPEGFRSWFKWLLGGPTSTGPKRLGALVALRSCMGNSPKMNMRAA